MSSPAHNPARDALAAVRSSPVLAILATLVACRPAPTAPPPAPTPAATPEPVTTPGPTPPAPEIADTADRDDDGVPDRDDRCPDTPMVMGPRCGKPGDGDGCPDSCAAPRF